MITTVATLLGGLILLLFSTQKFVELAKTISTALRVSPLIIGITIVAIGTSIPEIVVSLTSSLSGDTGLALGNIIGSNIINILMVLPVGILIGKLKIGTIKTQRNAVLLLVITAAFFVFQFFPSLRTVFGIVMIGLSVVFSIYQYQMGINGRMHEDVRRLAATKQAKLHLSMILQGLLMLLAIVFGGILVVKSVESISLSSGISTTILGLTLTAIATSLPELLTTIFSQKGKQEKIAVGNIIGSNIYNLLLIGGLIMFFPASESLPIKEWLWLAGATVGFVSILRYYSGKKPPRWIAIALLFILIAYLSFQ
ncbi:sodium:calcium antiporter [Candidatus Woesebacteria bacterium]|nr:sodium:calcium antiporter [Candidatus Woesebacteria bacterium]